MAAACGATKAAGCGRPAMSEGRSVGPLVPLAHRVGRCGINSGDGNQQQQQQQSVQQGSHLQQQQRGGRLTARVFSPSKTDPTARNGGVVVTDPEKGENSLREAPEKGGRRPEGRIAAIAAPVAEEVTTLDANLRQLVGQRHPKLMAAAEQIFGAGGKRLRPILVLLVAKATMESRGGRELARQHRGLAEITEMIHTASLVHDDVLDDCRVRRGVSTVNATYGTRLAVLAGDFLFAQASWGLANLENLEAIKLISQVIANFANGEIRQASSLFDTAITLEQYLDKSFYKTASLIAASCKCAAIFSDVDNDVKEAMYDYGKHLGLAFQIVDDILDFTQSTEQLGKPQGQDLASGNLTAPAIFALRSQPDLKDIVEGEFLEDGDLERAIELVKQGGGITAARALAAEEADKARAALACLPDSTSKASLLQMMDYVLERLY